MRLLRDEGLIVSRQGGGVYVRDRTERPVGLRPHLERAFERPEVSIDFAGFSGETLARRAHRAPGQDPRRPPPPHVGHRPPPRARSDDPVDASGDGRRHDGQPRLPRRARKITQRRTSAILESVHELGRVSPVQAELRACPVVPLFKLYIINGDEAFFGYYPVREHTITLDDEDTAIWNLMGKDTILFHHTADTDPDTIASQYVHQSARGSTASGIPSPARCRMSESAAELVSRTKHLLVDFDGPICSAFGAMTSRSVAVALIGLLHERGCETPSDVAAAHDPFDVLRFSATQPDREAAEAVAEELRRLETIAVDIAPPTADAVVVLRSLAADEHTVSVVSNNSGAAVRAYLARHGIDGIVTQVSSRESADVVRLKPAPFLLIEAMRNLGTRPEECVMIGDSVSDIQAARSAGTLSIAYANKPGKADRLGAARPDAVVGSMSELLPP